MSTTDTKYKDDSHQIEEGYDSDESSTSFHSLAEQIDSLNIDEEFPNKIADSTHTNGPKESGNLDNGEDEEKSEEKDIYFIDEDYLKDVEINISEEEKLDKQNKALDKKNDGNEKFKKELYKEAAAAYTEGLLLCPLSFSKDRAILYANRAAARSKLGEESQDKGSVEDCDKAILLDSFYYKAILRRANLHLKLENLEEALKDYKRVLELDPRNTEAQKAVMTLPQQIEEKNEKMKAEMMGKLKDLGNLILKPFGLSTNNFQLQQNSETGGYNINFNQNT